MENKVRIPVPNLAKLSDEDEIINKTNDIVNYIAKNVSQEIELGVVNFFNNLGYQTTNDIESVKKSAEELYADRKEFVGWTIIHDDIFPIKENVKAYFIPFTYKNAEERELYINIIQRNRKNYFKLEPK